ncbi:prostaglandin E synthase 3-like isoform X2 [Mercenaria mercenaria]|nr:prostaglandin E synthase 3-like isoform X2 [Mercenaria mercenaria]XP_053374485.1 prostaglandin E synthase 3-like isoform X2 [Mercenaria mercenaria]
MWAQRNDVVFLTICLEDCESPTINLTEQKLTFSGKGGTNKDLFEISLEFEKEVNPQESKYAVKPRNVSFVIKKKESGPYWPRLLKGIKKAFWLKTDFNKWKDEDESDDDMDKNMDLAEMMQNMGGMGGGMGGMGGGPGGPGLIDDEEDSDDEDLPDLE